MIKLFNVLGEILFALTPGVAAGTFFVFRYFRKRRMMFLCFCLLFCALIRMIYGFTTARYYAVLLVPGIPLAIYGVHHFSRFLEQKFQRCKISRQKIFTTIMVVMCAVSTIRLFCLQKAKLHLKQIPAAIIADISQRKLKYPLVIETCKIKNYLQAQQLNTLSVPYQKKALEVPQILFWQTAPYDGVYFIQKTKLNSGGKLFKNTAGMPEKPVAEFAYRQDKFGIYYFDIGNIGSCRPAPGTPREACLNGNFSMLSANQSPAGLQLQRKGFVLPAAENWPRFWAVNPLHYWNYSPEKGDGIQIGLIGTEKKLIMQSHGKITIEYTVPIDFLHSQGISFFARGIQNGCFKVFMHEKSASKHCFYVSPNFCTVDEERYYTIAWKDFRKFCGRKPNAQYTWGIEFHKGQTCFSNFSWQRK